MTHESVRKARQRNADPDWARAKFDEGRTLYRFRVEDREALIDDITFHCDELAEVAHMAGNESAPLQRDAAAFMRGLTHRNTDIVNLGEEAWALILKAERAEVRARWYEMLREPVGRTAGDLRGEICCSIDDIVALGRRAGNCLANDERRWRSLVSGASDFWSLMDGDRLVGILEVERARGEVVEALGPGNTVIDICDAERVARFCVEPGEGSEEVLTLSFDPQRTCGDCTLLPDDPRGGLARFGKKRVRRIVRAIALDQIVPSLVQHRLLVLAA